MDVNFMWRCTKLYDLALCRSKVGDFFVVFIRKIMINHGKSPTKKRFSKSILDLPSGKLT